MFPTSVAIIVVGEKQPKSKRVTCSGCRKVLEYLPQDIAEVPGGLLYITCPRRLCKRQVYLGTAEKVRDGS